MDKKLFEMNMNNVAPVTSRVETNEKTKDYAEVIKALVYGNANRAELNSMRDTVSSWMKEKAAAAMVGDIKARNEINAVITLVVEPEIIQATALYGLMGNYHELAYNETAKVQTWNLTGGDARMQGLNGDVPFGDYEWSEYPISTVTISGGIAVDYREMSMGNIEGHLPEQIQHLTTDMNNKAMAYIMDTVFAALKGNTEYVKFYDEYTGTITQTAVDSMLNKMRKFGHVSVLGDYSVLSTISGWAGHQTVGTTALPFYTPQQVEAINKTGLVQDYKGSTLVEIPNPYNLTKPLADKTAFETYYSTKRTLFIPTGMNSPVNIFRRGGITTMTGNDVKTGRILTRYDMEIGADVVKGREYMIGAEVATD